MIKLYQIDNELMAVLNAPNPETGELNEEALDQLSLARTEKQKNVTLYIKSLEQGETAIDAELKRLRDMKAAAQKRTEWLKNYLKTSMEAMGETELSFGVHTAKIANNPPSVQIVDEPLLPSEFKKEIIETKIDKVAIKQAIKGGVVVPGATLAYSTRLDIK